MKNLLSPLLWLPLLSAATTNQTSWYPKYHLAPQQGWMNDPNGLIYHDGYYHAFWQYNPYEPVWGPMHWGHARSKNLLSWEYLPIALTPSLPEDADGVFSGSAISENGRITIVYTGVSENGTRQRQMAAVSTDGIEFEKLGVILDRDGSEENFRDPKVWHRDGIYFVVVGSKTEDNRGQVLLYLSTNFTGWTFEGALAQADEDLGYMWECPDFFDLDDKSVLIVSPQGMPPKGFDYQNLFQTGYFVGTWAAGKTYQIEKGFREVDKGHDFYAPQTFLAPDGRRIQIGWLGMWESVFPESEVGWAGMLTLPRELTLSESRSLQVKPVREIQSVRKLRSADTYKSTDISAKLATNIFNCEALVVFNLTETTSSSFGIKLVTSRVSNEGVKVYVNRTESRLYLERYYPQQGIELSSRSVEVDLALPVLSLDVFFDGSSIEVFVNDGQAVLSSRIYPSDDQRSLYIFGDYSTACSYRLWDF